MIFPTQLAVEALGLTATGVPSTRESSCCMCSAPIHKGDLYVHPDFGKGFMDATSLASRSGAVCGFCATSKQIAVLRNMQKAVFSKDGAFPLAKDVHRAWFLLTPPEPPFVAVISDAMTQHLVWRTPVSWSKDVFVVRLGQQLLKIRRPMLIKAVESAADFMANDEKNSKSKNPMKHPFATLSRELDGLSHGAIRPEFIGRVPDILLKLTPGELWAMATLAKRDTPIPEAPEKITMSGEITNAI